MQNENARSVIVTNIQLKFQKRRIATFACNHLYVFVLADGDLTDVTTPKYNQVLINNWLEIRQ